MEVGSCINCRKSVRHFQKCLIEENVIYSIISAALQAPSPKNIQPWKFKIVREEKEKQNLSKILYTNLVQEKQECEKRGVIRRDIIQALDTVPILEQADTLVFTFLDRNLMQEYEDGVKWSLKCTEKECTYILSLGAAIENMLLKATSLEVGSLWIADIFYAYNDIVNYLDIDYDMLGVVALGYPEEIERSIPYKKKKRIEDVVL